MWKAIAQIIAIVLSMVVDYFKNKKAQAKKQWRKLEVNYALHKANRIRRINEYGLKRKLNRMSEKDKVEGD